MNVRANPDPAANTEIAPERLLNRAARSDFYFTPELWIGSMTQRVEALLEDMVRSDIQVMDMIGRHMLFGYAKRLRPVFVLLAQKMFNDEIEDATIDAAAICELIHCASLFHDDVIDGARTRKGRQAANTIWGNKSAVIMGDHFFVLAFTRLTELNDLKLIKLFVDTCRYLAEGVMLEIKHQRDLKVTEEIHTDIITRKTATFFETACVAGGYLGGADEDEQEILATLGMNFGLAFQMSDDLLDLFADPDATGKPRGTDLNAGIYTVPVIHALKDNSNFQDRFIKDLSGETLNPEIILDIADTIRKNGSYEYSISEVRRYSKIALDALDKLPDNSANESFRALINKIVERDYV